MVTTSSSSPSLPFMALAPPDHVWNESIISRNLLVWGFPVSGFRGSRACRAVIYQHAALSDLMYPYVLNSKLLGEWKSARLWESLVPSLTTEGVGSWLQRSGACSVRWTVLGIQVGSYHICCCVRTLQNTTSWTERTDSQFKWESSVYRIEQRKCQVRGNEKKLALLFWNPEIAKQGNTNHPPPQPNKQKTGNDGFE